MGREAVGRVLLFLAATALASAALLALGAGGVASAHPLGFESDLTEDRVIGFCNPDEVKPGLFGQAISDWNSYALDNSHPVIADVTNAEGAFCELRAGWRGGNSADYLARVVFDAHPDDLDVSERLTDLPRPQKGATLRHELGHAAVGLDHNEECGYSVMPPYAFCRQTGTPRSATVGPHDAEDRLAYWNGETPLYPIPNKCWTNEDADGDGVCDRFGPPLVDVPQAARAQRDDEDGAAPVEAPKAVE